MRVTNPSLPPPSSHFENSNQKPTLFLIFLQKTAKPIFMKFGSNIYVQLEEGKREGKRRRDEERGRETATFFFTYGLGIIRKSYIKKFIALKELKHGRESDKKKLQKIMKISKIEKKRNSKISYTRRLEKFHEAMPISATPR